MASRYYMDRQPPATRCARNGARSLALAEQACAIQAASITNRFVRATPIEARSAHPALRRARQVDGKDGAGDVVRLTRHFATMHVHDLVDDMQPESESFA
jgi:hypothetical protein